MQKLVFINGNGTQIDLTAGNFGITNWAGLSNTGLNIQTQQVPFEDGGVFLDALMEQREIEVTVAIYDGNNLELRYQKKRELISALNPKLGEGTLIYTNDYLSRQIKAVPQIPLFENKNSNDAGTLKASVAFSCPSPYWEDVEETQVTISEAGTVIKNEGDIETQVSIKFESNDGDIEFENPLMINRTTGQEIEITGNFRSPVFVNTNLGQKAVYQREIQTQTPMKKLTPIEILKNGEYKSKDFVFSSHYNCYLLWRGGLLKSTDGEIWETLFVNGGGYDKISVVDSLIIISGEGSDKLLMSNNLVDWVEVTTSIYYSYCIACKRNNIIEIYASHYDNGIKLYKATVLINDNVITLGTFTQETIFTDYKIARDNLFVYNEKLNCVAVITEDTTNHLKCYFKGSNNAWTRKGDVSYPNFEMTCSGGYMILYGTQYGYIEYSADGLTWTQKTIIADNVRDIEYYEEENLFIAVGQKSWDGYPLIAVSPDLETWYYFTTSTFARIGEGTPEALAGSFIKIIYNYNTLKYLFACNYRNYDNQNVQFVIIDLKDYINLISSITTSSDMTFKLTQGNNTLFIEEGIKGLLSYRQKYIGV